MIENLDALEKKVALLIDKLEKAKDIIVKLDDKNKELQAKYTKEVNDANARIALLESQIGDYTSKSDSVKSRIDSVLEKIDLIETSLLSEEEAQDN